MGEAAVLVLFLALILTFFVPAAQGGLRRFLGQRPAWIWAAPPVLAAAFAGAAMVAGAFSAPLTLLVLGYASAPVLCAYAQGPGPVERPTALDLLAILLLWLPIEFTAGARFVAPPAQGFLHSVAYGVAIVLGLTLFLTFRAFPGMKFNLPRTRRDLWLPLAGFALLAPVLAVAGRWIGFLPAPHLPIRTASQMAEAVPLILLGTALPEEILFRSLIQNLLMLRYGDRTRTLFAASIIFGCAHLDNGPQALPNWRYAILATIAGLAYGKVFQEGSTVFASSALHMLVDWTKHFFF